MEINTIIERLGGTMATARLMQCEHPPICQWRCLGIPKIRVMYLQAVRPDVLEGTRWQVDPPSEKRR